MARLTRVGPPHLALGRHYGWNIEKLHRVDKTALRPVILQAIHYVDLQRVTITVAERLGVLSNLAFVVR